MPVTKTKDNINPSLNRIVDELQTKVTKKAFLEFRVKTPVRTGNARRKTSLKGNKIKAAYPYATFLDAGRSRQSPDGMSKPTTELITKEIEKIFRK